MIFICSLISTGGMETADMRRRAHWPLRRCHFRVTLRMNPRSRTVYITSPYYCTRPAFVFYKHRELAITHRQKGVESIFYHVGHLCIATYGVNEKKSCSGISIDKKCTKRHKAFLLDSHVPAVISQFHPTYNIHLWFVDRSGGESHLRGSCCKWSLWNFLSL